jgi:hypothetical protein
MSAIDPTNWKSARKKCLSKNAYRTIVKYALHTNKSSSLLDTVKVKFTLAQAIKAQAGVEV